MKLIYILLIGIFGVSLLFSCKSNKVITSEQKVTTPTPIIKVTPPPPAKTIVNFLSEYLKLKYKGQDFSKYMYISVKHQRLYLIVHDSMVKNYPISTALNGIGSKQNSMKTPPGLHIVKRKIGKDVPLGGILESRIYNGKIAKILTNKVNAKKDYVTTRIMWLQGEEQGLNRGRNVDSYNRYIYIHGTPEEGFIGQPASHGCIRMKNKDVIELFDLVEEGTPILILKF